MKYYLDSNVFIPYFNKELGKGHKPLYQETLEFLEKARKKKIKLVLSDLFYKEVCKICYLSKQEILEELQKLHIEIIETKINKEHVKTLLEKEIHLGDAVHASTAIYENCNAIITFNKKDFLPAKNLIQILEPNEF
jgi:predicted nucleic acid-binding protein